MNIQRKPATSNSTLNPFIFYMYPYIFIWNPYIFAWNSYIFAWNPNIFTWNPYISIHTKEHPSQVVTLTLLFLLKTKESNIPGMIHKRIVCLHWAISVAAQCCVLNHLILVPARIFFLKYLIQVSINITILYLTKLIFRLVIFLCILIRYIIKIQEMFTN